jgi:hypothetical protein
MGDYSRLFIFPFIQSIWKHWVANLDYFGECDHSKHTCMVLILFFGTTMWYNMQPKCYCAIHQTSSLCKKGIKSQQGKGRNYFVQHLQLKWWRTIKHKICFTTCKASKHLVFIGAKCGINNNNPLVPIYNHHLLLHCV